MSLDEKFIPVQIAFYNIISRFFKKIAELFGYPNNPGMPTFLDVSNEVDARSNFLDNLPTHRTFWPPVQRPETWFEMIFGPSPKVGETTGMNIRTRRHACTERFSIFQIQLNTKQPVRSDDF